MIPEMNPPSSVVSSALSSVRLPLDLRSVCYPAMVLPEFCFPGFSYHLSNFSIFFDLFLFFKIGLIFSKDKMKTQYFLRILSFCVGTSLHLPSYFPSQNHALRLPPPGITSLHAHNPAINHFFLLAYVRYLLLLLCLSNLP